MALVSLVSGNYTRRMTLSTRLNDLFRANVADLLEKYGWNQNDLAAAMGVTRGYVSQVMTGHVGIGLEGIEKFAEALSVEPSKLIAEKKVAAKAG